jgi:hypothetical protein
MHAHHAIGCMHQPIFLHAMTLIGRELGGLVMGAIARASTSIIKSDAPRQPRASSLGRLRSTMISGCTTVRTSSSASLPSGKRTSKGATFTSPGDALERSGDLPHEFHHQPLRHAYRRCHGISHAVNELVTHRSSEIDLWDVRCPSAAQTKHMQRPFTRATGDWAWIANDRLESRVYWL